MCIIRNWCTKGFWAPNGDDGTGKPGANKPPHASYNNPPNFLQLWPLILAHFHLLIGVLEIICISWEREQSKEVALPQVADEEEWKSVARRKMLQFEQQLHEGEKLF